MAEERCQEEGYLDARSTPSWAASPPSVAGKAWSLTPGVCWGPSHSPWDLVCPCHLSSTVTRAFWSLDSLSSHRDHNKWLSHNATYGTCAQTTPNKLSPPRSLLPPFCLLSQLIAASVWPYAGDSRLHYIGWSFRMPLSAFLLGRFLILSLKKVIFSVTCFLLTLLGWVRSPTWLPPGTTESGQCWMQDDLEWVCFWGSCVPIDSMESWCWRFMGTYEMLVKRTTH